jgi:hypothetical protein
MFVRWAVWTDTVLVTLYLLGTGSYCDAGNVFNRNLKGPSLMEGTRPTLSSHPFQKRHTHSMRLRTEFRGGTTDDGVDSACIITPYPAVSSTRNTSTVLAELRTDFRHPLSSLFTTTRTNFTILSETVLYENWRRLISRQVQFPSGHVANFEVVGQGRRTKSLTPLKNDTQSHAADEAVLIFVWYRTTKTTTLIREYMPSVHDVMYGLAAGMVEVDKHTHWHDDNDTTFTVELNTSSTQLAMKNTLRTSKSMSVPEIAARHELEEECQLKDGTWIQLTDQPVVMDKYSMTGLYVFLLIDPISIFDDHRDATQPNITTTKPPTIRLPRDDSEEGMEIVTNVTVPKLFQLIYGAKLTAVGSWASLLALHHLRRMGEIN